MTKYPVMVTFVVNMAPTEEETGNGEHRPSVAVTEIATDTAGQYSFASKITLYLFKMEVEFTKIYDHLIDL